MNRPGGLLRLLAAGLCAAFCACARGPDYAALVNAGPYGAERAFVESLLPEGLELGEPPALVIEFHSSWEYENAFGDILISRTPLVPQADALDGRTDAALADCLAGRETLVPPEALAPPAVALRVDGRALGGEGYPLYRAVGVSVRGAGDAPLKDRLEAQRLRLEAAIRDAPKSLIRPIPAPVWIAAGGDLMLDRGAEEILFQEGPEGIFGGTAAMLEAAGIALVNLEGVVSVRGEKTPKSFNFRFSPRIAPALKAAGISAALHANNHVYDYGEIAFLDSLSALEGAGIGIAGAGLDDDAASAPCVMEREGGTFRVFGLASFPRERNGWDGVSAAAGPGRPGMLHTGKGGGEKLKARFDRGDPRIVDVVLFHGGVEWSRRPDAATRELYTDLIRSGADLVIGSHPHIVQGFEWVLGKPVFWSLGNYVFGGMENTDGGEEGLFIRLGFLDSRLIYLEPFALTLTHTRTDIAPPEKLEVFYRRSRELRE